MLERLPEAEEDPVARLARAGEEGHAKIQAQKPHRRTPAQSAAQHVAEAKGHLAHRGEGIARVVKGDAAESRRVMVAQLLVEDGHRLTAEDVALGPHDTRGETADAVCATGLETFVSHQGLAPERVRQPQAVPLGPGHRLGQRMAEEGLGQALHEVEVRAQGSRRDLETETEEAATARSTGLSRVSRRRERSSPATRCDELRNSEVTETFLRRYP